MSSTSNQTLQSCLRYQPQVLRFGTSGRRGEVVHLTQLEVYINALAELQYLQSLPVAEGGIARGDDLYFGYDLRPSSTEFVPAENGRGEIAQAIVRAVTDAGMEAVNCGAIPTPALTSFALSRGKGSIMVTGSHIPFNRNGYKTNTARGELLKKHEMPINQAVEQARHRLYTQPFNDSLFNENGMFKTGHVDLPAIEEGARVAYVRRYVDFFPVQALGGKRLLFYQHSAVGRDLVVEILKQLGAEVISSGRSETFVPIDTENIDAEQLETIQALTDEATAAHGRLDAVVSTDGDSDRPLVLGVNNADHKVHFYGGDLLGMVVAEYLGADAVVVPISCNDAIDRGNLAGVLQPKTRIGSPFVIAGMEAALSAGKQAVCGWEANGGFLTGSDITRNGRTLKALPTRDAVLPILGVLLSAAEKKITLSSLFGSLPRRFSRAALLKNFPRATALKIVEKLTPAQAEAQEFVFADKFQSASPADQLAEIRQQLKLIFTDADGFGVIRKLNYTDGVRITFENGDVAHLRPSGNADEFRIYAVSDTQARSEVVAAKGVTEPGGLLRTAEKLLA